MIQTEMQPQKAGYTLVELMVALFLAAIASIAIYRGYVSFTSGSDAQEQIIEMQQNLRIGMRQLTMDIRRAGLNEEDDDTAGFTVAEANKVTFTMDLWGVSCIAYNSATDNPYDDHVGDGDVDDYNEGVTYEIKDGDGDADNKELVRTNNCGVALDSITNLDALDFVYLDEDGNDLDPDTTPIDPATGRTPLTAAQMADIRVVEVTMVVRTTNEDYRYTNSENYTNLQGNVVFIGPGDNYRRRAFTRQVQIRNMGL